MGFSKIDFVIWIAASAIFGILFWLSQAVQNDAILVIGIFVICVLAISIRHIWELTDRN